MSKVFILQEEVIKAMEGITLKEYPETYVFLNVFSHPRLPYAEEEDLVDLAETVMSLDGSKAFPPEVIDFVTILCEQEIEKGNVAAMKTLGSYYRSGNRGFEQDFVRAEELFGMADESGNEQI